MKNLSISARRTLLLGISWALSYVVCLFVIRQLHPNETAGILLALTPAVTFVLFIVQLVRSMSEMDEVERRIQLEATVWAFSLSILLMMILGLLDLVVELSKDDWSYRHLVPFLFIFYLIGIVISRRKYLGDEK